MERRHRLCFPTATSPNVHCENSLHAVLTRLLNTPCERRRCKHDWTVGANSVKSLDICVKWLLKDGSMTSSLASMKLLQIVEKLWNKDIGAGCEWDKKERKEHETKTNVTNSEHIYVVTPSNHYTLWPLSRNVSLRCQHLSREFRCPEVGIQSIQVYLFSTRSQQQSPQSTLHCKVEPTVF